jgi:Holliday junction DNA helicase RuvB
MDNSDRALRPENFVDFIGQTDAIRNLRTFAAAAKSRGEVLEHVLISGPPGLGKTTLAAIIAAEMGSRLKVVNSPSVRNKGDLASVLLSLEDGDVLFLDEIHSLKLDVEEILYPAMEDGKLQIVTGHGSSSEAINMPLAKFTLIGATTRPGLISQPLRDRFGESVQLQLYSVEELTSIVLRTAKKLGVHCDDSAASEIARRSRGTPRLANRLFRRVRDFMYSQSVTIMTIELVKDSCKSLGIDSAGLDVLSQNYLKFLFKANKPAGLNVIASVLGESKDTIDESIEPYLMRMGFITRTPSGRIITAEGRKHLSN